MPRPPSPSSSFSARRRWGIFFSVLVSIAAVLALVGMLNYLGARYFLRFNWSPKTTQKLSQRTLGLLQSITNEVKVVIYYDKSKDDSHYSPVSALLNEYHLANPKISVQTVDYVRDSTAARAVQKQYHLTSANDKDVIIFDYTNRTFAVPDKILWEYGPMQQVISEGQPVYDRKLRAFHGEEACSAALLNVTDPHPFNACYLTDHGEHLLDSQDEKGYGQFSELLALNNIVTTNLTLAGTNTVPADCNLLIIAGPCNPISTGVNKIRQYLAQGGRLLVLFNNYDNLSTGNYQAGLEQLLLEYGVDAGRNLVKDRGNSSGSAIVVRDFNDRHQLSSPLQGYMLAVISPRSVGKSKAGQQDSDSLSVTELAWTGEKATLLANNTEYPANGRVPLMVAVEKANAKAGLAGPAASTRIVVVGDSLCLENQILANAPDAANSAFAALAVNWLLERTQLLAGVGSHPVTEYRLAMTASQLKSLNWIFLAAMPGGVLAFGVLVWLRRRR